MTNDVIKNSCATYKGYRVYKIEGMYWAGGQFYKSMSEATEAIDELVIEDRRFTKIEVKEV